MTSIGSEVVLTIRAKQQTFTRVCLCCWDADVDVLLLLDAERAVQQGRFREAVLFCWSTIDSVFNRGYARLSTPHWRGSGWRRGSSLRYDFGLRNKMSAGMRFVAGRSLFVEPAELWTRLSTSYNERNNIIHRGENATEDEARTALDVARAVVQIMREVALAAAIGG